MSEYIYDYRGKHQSKDPTIMDEVPAGAVRLRSDNITEWENPDQSSIELHACCVSVYESDRVEVLGLFEHFHFIDFMYNQIEPGGRTKYSTVDFKIWNKAKTEYCYYSLIIGKELY